MGGVKGNAVEELRAYAKTLGGLKEAGKRIGAIAAPKIVARAALQAEMQCSPYGTPWQPGKAGGSVLTTSPASIEVTLRNAGTAIRVRLLYPLGFHNDGTYRVGRKRGAVVRRKFIGAGLKAVGRASVPRRRKGESDDAFAHREQRFAVQRELFAFARDKERKRLNPVAHQAEREARAAGGVWDPKRPLIPNEGQGIPGQWSADLLDSAREVMSVAGAELRR